MNKGLWTRRMDAAAKRLDNAAGGCDLAAAYYSPARARRALREAEEAVAMLRKALRDAG